MSFNMRDGVVSSLPEKAVSENGIIHSKESPAFRHSSGRPRSCDRWQMRSLSMPWRSYLLLFLLRD